MLQCAKEVADRTSGRRMNYTEFCTYPKDLKRSNDRSHPRQLGKIQDRNGQEKKKKSRKMSKASLTHEVFLGGSCNPTTWRHDVAMPLLDSFGISYYNPQVSEWSAELVAVEHRAKACAKLLFYVLDKRTRNVVSILEAANLIASQRNLVLVIDNYQPNQSVAGEVISNKEFNELGGSLATLHDLVEKHGIPTFSNISVAINFTAKLLREKHKERGNNKHNSAAKFCHVQVGDKLFELKEVFDALDPIGSGEISLNEFCLAYRLLTNKKLAVSDLSGIIIEKKDANIGGIKVNFEQFCAMVAKLKTQNGTTEKWACCSKFSSANRVHQYALDVYVSGSCFDSTWKQHFPLPILMDSGLRFKLADCWSQNSSNGRPSDVEAMDNSYVLLFMITSDTRGLETMALASYYISLGRNVVLCVQDLVQGCSIANEKLTEAAINDYNRGRCYLKDEARRRGVPVFQNVCEAVECTVDKCTNSSQSGR